MKECTPILSSLCNVCIRQHMHMMRWVWLIYCGYGLKLCINNMYKECTPILSSSCNAYVGRHTYMLN